MRIYLFDLDDTVVSTVGHACRELYPAVARSLGCPVPSEADIRATWGQSLSDVLPTLFSGAEAKAVLSALQSAHRATPPPAIPGVVRRLKGLLRENCVVIIFSAGHPDIVRNTVRRSLGLDPDEPRLIYTLPAGRRLRPVDIDIIRDMLDVDESSHTTLVFSDTPADRVAVADDTHAVFYGVTTGVADRLAHLAAGTPPDMIYDSVADALDVISEKESPGRQVETSDLIGQLQMAIGDRKVVVFLGAGVSVESGLPTAAGLARHFGQPTDSLERLTTAQGFDAVLYSDLHRLIADPKLRPNQLHRALALLDAPYYVSTNWDHLLERAFMDLYGDSYEDDVGIAYIDSHLPGIMGRRNAYIKLHGDISRKDSLVLDFASYSRRLSQPTLLDKLVEVLLNSSAVLFVGYSVSDINVITQLIEHRSWEGAAPPPRFAILHGVGPADRQFFRAAGIHVIDTGSCQPAETGRRTFEVLALLHDAKEDFASDAQLMSGHADDGPVELFYQALTHYRESQFTRATEVLRVAREKILDWRRHLPLLARFSYLTVKLYDKLEQWDELVNVDRLYLQNQFRRVEPVMPSTLFAWMLGHYQSALALAALRAGQPHMAREYIEPSIDSARRQPFAARLLLSDRRVMRAIILQYLAMMGRPQDLSAIDDLVFARGALARHGGLGTAHEVHFAGRFYGATVFVALSFALDSVEGARLLGPDSTLADYALRSHAKEQRLPYGVVAGRYCNAYFHYHSMRSAGPPDEARVREALALLDIRAVGGEIGPSAQLKCDLLADRIEGLSGAAAKAVSGKAGPLPVYAAQHIANLGVESWLATPVN